MEREGIAHRGADHDHRVLLAESGSTLIDRVVARVFIVVVHVSDHLVQGGCPDWGEVLAGNGVAEEALANLDCCVSNNFKDSLGWSNGMGNVPWCLDVLAKP